ncbi:MAG: CotH kinase family protein [Cryomorphaceae bacterium]|nr:CotH kinase family protein [Cryomorphaceae bacterium]
MLKKLHFYFQVIGISLFNLHTNNYLTAQSIAINEVMASNGSDTTDEDGHNEDWIELYNYGTSSINLNGYGLSDDYGDVFKWILPQVILDPNEYLLIFASGKNRNIPGLELHTNFRINSSGEEIILTRPDSVRIDELPPTPIPRDLSYGRFPNGTGSWQLYSETTPAHPNGSAAYLPPPNISHLSGFYNNSFNLNITHPDSSVIIIYTLDGSVPDTANLTGFTYFFKNSYPELPGQPFGQLLPSNIQTMVFANTVQIKDRSADSNIVASKSTTWHHSPPYLPSSTVKKSTVIKTRVVKDGHMSNYITRTYFIDTTGTKFNSTLPTISLSLDENHLFDYQQGINVAGIDFDDWRTANQTDVTTGHVSGNYQRRGLSHEKEAVFQYFVNENEVLNQKIGIRIHGGFSRSLRNKSFRLYARKEYDTQNRFDYPFFGSENSNSFNRLLLRNSGNDGVDEWIGNNETYVTSPVVYFRDALIQRIVSHMNFETQDYQPANFYVNGEYYGILNIRERYDKHYIDRVFGINESELDLLTQNAEVKLGSSGHYISMRNFVKFSNMSITSNYEVVKTQMDVENFIDYTIAQIYSRNTDWPSNNIDFFRKQTSQYEPSAPYGQDGRWRWLMFDTDHGFGWTGDSSWTHNSLERASSSVGWSRVLLYKLFDNTEFKHRFINRYADMLNTTFRPSRVNALIDQYEAAIADEVPNHQNRWGTLNNWGDNVLGMKKFADERPAFARDHIREKFNISGNDVTLTLDVSNNQHGFVKINTIKIIEETPGVDFNPYPWSGLYFNDIPITIKAIAKPGFVFTHWSGDISGTDPEINITPTSNMEFIANFGFEDSTDYIHFWVFDTDIDNNTPLDSLSATYTKQSISGEIIFHSSFGAMYPFSQNHPLWRKASMERRNAPSALNYDSSVNDDEPFGNFPMRGLQIKQPFETDSAKNELIIDVSTELYHEITLSFAVKNEGAASGLKIDYWDTISNKWVTDGMPDSIYPISFNFEKIVSDFSNCPTANNNKSFKIRISFIGNTLDQDNGHRVTFNNIGVSGVHLNLQKEEYYEDNVFPYKNDIVIYPNPSHGNVFVKNIPQHNETGSSITFEIFDMSGKCVYTKSQTPKSGQAELDLSHLAPGVYIFNIQGNLHVSRRLIKN